MSGSRGTLIVGGGIGGLALARALAQRGLAAEIVERAVEGRTPWSLPRPSRRDSR
jgi:2-polyprenyl-6-methoxyphenol hydroxylase-like FAD-dependent oxidoreductase